MITLPRRVTTALLNSDFGRQVVQFSSDTYDALRAAKKALVDLLADVAALRISVADIQEDPRWTDDRIAYALRSASTVVDVSAAAAPSAGQVLTAIDDSNAEWQTPSGGGGGGGAIDAWHPDSPDTGATFYDAATSDDFDAGSIGAKWTENDPAGVVTFSIDTTRQMLKADVTGIAAIRWGFLFQPVPGSEFAVYTRVFPLHSSQPTLAGLFVSQDMSSAPTTADTRAVYTGVYNGTPLVQAGSLTDYTGNAGAGGAFDLTNGSGYWAYLRIRVNGTAWRADISFDGISWFPFDSRTLGFTPASFGLAVYVENATVNAIHRFPFVRVYSGAGSSALDGTALGAFV